MVERIGGLPYWELRFDGQGDTDPVLRERLLTELPGQGVSDLFVFSHGWNNDPETAKRIYGRFFELVEPLLAQHGSDAARVGVAGVIWPSMAWLDEPIPDFPVEDGGAVSLGDVALSDGDLVTALKAIFPLADQQRQLDELAALLDERPDDPERLDDFHRLLKGLVESDPSGETAVEDAGEVAMLTDDAVEVYGRFLASSEVLLAGGGMAGDEEPAAGLSVADPLRLDPYGAAGLADLGGRLWSGAKVALRQATYFVMKRRAGAVGQQGLGPLLGELSAVRPQLRVHLIGHSFGARLVSFALAGLPPGLDPSPVKSLLLIQGAFSHFAFARTLPYNAGRAGALAGQEARVDGPLVCCFSVHDTAVGVLYPVASFSSREDAASRSDLAYRWGAMGHDGAQNVDSDKVFILAVGKPYPLSRGRFLNVDAKDVVREGRPLAGAHSDIFHPELAWVAVSGAGLV